MEGMRHSAAWTSALGWSRAAVRYLSQHTGLPALVVGAILVALGYRILKRTARFVIEVALVAVGLAAATQLGWLQW
jgi:hypothetical protein